MMTTQTVSIELPEEIYQRFKGMAAVTQRSLEEVIFQTIRGNLPPTLDDLPLEQRDVVADLQPLNDEALWAVAREPLPVQRWRRHQRLLRSLGWVGGAAPTAIDALREAVWPGGAVLVPTLTGTIQDGPEHPPVFDPRTTPCWTGAIPETFRRLPSARRSCHPTHSVAAIGPATD